MEGGDHRGRLTLLDQMSAPETGRPRTTLDSVLRTEKRSPPHAAETSISSRTLLDIIRDDYKEGNSDRKSWKAFRDKLRLKRAGSAWISSIHIPASDVPLQITHSDNFSRRQENVQYGDSVPPAVLPPRSLFARRSSTRISSESTNPEESSEMSPMDRTYRPQFSRNSSTRSATNPDAVDDDEELTPRDRSRRLGAALTEERVLSARDAVAAQEAAEAEAAASAAEEETAAAAASALATETEPASPEPVRMSLMDLLEETDRQMGVVGSRYVINEEEEEFEEYQGPEEAGTEVNCCVCMIRSKGAAFIPCGHTFCRLCSRELWVQRGNCPLCNGFILEILDIF